METTVSTKDAILSALEYRHATKVFDDTKKISEADFNFILEVGRLSPSSFGYEPWKFVVIQNPEMREKLLTFTWGGQKQLPTSSHFVVILSRLPQDLHANSDYIQDLMRNVQKLPTDVIEGRERRYEKFLKYDFTLEGNDRALFEWGCRQSYIALGNMTTAAAQIGIDSCPIEGFSKEKIEEILAAEGIMDSEHFGISCMVAFGYRLNEPREKTRRTSDQVTQWV
ncbi:NAD(P)H-dependent oxidoreductase [Paenibacillus sp. WQ 127069]|uniref:NAD(P)H-dependent oxidoreductase n=1 Tax=Paenibacillus baimaensis TaxID=2982185 RepID=A0ABT2UF59_9BACL|nr:NAD(P)H-dependent oxidoreductase [Paenibacillus sp. WQ 127069]MCU6793277.1 NAD(P)H-dependent oxidoreductase [Paenibacillus sp. WQ 127069]